jgi:hypothetical protein
VVFVKYPRTLDCILHKISLQKVPDFEIIIKKDPAQKNQKPEIFRD